MAKRTARRIFDEAKTCPNDVESKALSKWAAQSLNANRIRAMLEMVRSEVAVTLDDLDRDPDLLNVTNGTLDLRTGQLSAA